MASLLAQTTFYLPPDISEHGYQVDRLINFVHIFMAVLFIGWGVFFLHCLFKYRQRPGTTARYEPIKAKPSKYIEVAVVLVEVVLLFGLSMPVWAEYKNDPPAASDNPFKVRVIAQQFQWNIHYPGPDGEFGDTKVELMNEESNPIGLDTSGAGADDLQTVNELAVPVDRDVYIEVSSKDVLHSFGIPMLRVKQDTVPGMRIPVWFKANKTSSQVRDSMIRTVAVPPKGGSGRRFLTFTKDCIASEDYADGGTTVVASGSLITPTALEALQEAGITEIQVKPREPVEIHCAQLCGLGHYRMRGDVKIFTPEEFDNWWAELQPGEFDEGGFDDFDDFDE